ncbi:NAD-dependent deacylase [Chachezhania antarctica]|uniref:NAD-dependent deacylase n=1 Tax=Chachezhania antarctica TaxID=2340860 RepID=UPI000EB11482|nr:NAD-dependent deacylase [Chachezhania antarctica]|tara:strand:+ start:8465 stop:9160 length:696 start_codon:yes stop_codon:yes gene_type:complete
MDKIVILTGAGISAESGMGTFRDKDGLWTKVQLEDVATPEGFARNPQMVQDFYNLRRVGARAAKPNAAHTALARLQAHHTGDVIIVTQNVDSLHEAGGARDVIHMHGRLDGALCSGCGHRWAAPDEMTVDEACPGCGEPFGRPDVVWFGEMPYRMDEIYEHLGTTDLFVSIGTSGEVYPAASFVQEARVQGIRTLELNLEPSSGSAMFDESRLGPATEIVPAWVAEVLGEA